MPDITDKTPFNYNDTLAVTRLTKKVLRSTGFESVETNDVWSQIDEFAWKSFCDSLGGKYTPFPDLPIQPEDIKKLFRDNEDGIESITKQSIPSLHRDFAVAPYKIEKSSGKIIRNVVDMEHPPVKRSKPGSVNFGIMQGTMSRFTNNETVGETIDLRASNKSEQPTSAQNSKMPANIRAHNADGKLVEPGKDILEKVHNPNFDPSAPPRDSRVEETIKNAPDITDTSAKEGTDKEKEKKNKAMEHRESNSTSTR